jgi:FeS assembly SUF system protein
MSDPATDAPTRPAVEGTGPSGPDAAPPAAAPLAAGAEPPAAVTAAPDELEPAIVEALSTVYDPEIPVNIYELGLIYDIDIQPGGKVAVKMTLTSPACPVAGSLPGEVQDKVRAVDGVTAAEVEVVWDPVWNPSMMSEAAKLQLGMF